MKRGSTSILRAAVIFIGLIVLLVCIFALPRAINSELKGDFDYGPIFLGLYVAAAPFFAALYQTLKLLKSIDKKRIFSKEPIKALQSIKYCAYIISGLFSLGMPYVFYVADRDDAPGVVALGFIIIGVSFVIAAAAAMFQGLLQNAVDIKSENDLTV